MNPKQIVTMVICIIVIVACGAWIYKRWRELNPRPQPVPMMPPAAEQPAAPPGG